MAAIEVRNTKFETLGQGVLDGRKRLSLAKAVEVLRERFGDDVARLHFVILYNSSGDILLRPETTIPLREAWLHRNASALKSVLAGIEQAQDRQLLDRGSFVPYANDTDKSE